MDTRNRDQALRRRPINSRWLRWRSAAGGSLRLRLGRTRSLLSQTTVEAEPSLVSSSPGPEQTDIRAAKANISVKIGQ